VKTPALAKMTVDALISLRDNVDRIVRTRAKSERKALEKQLAKLAGYSGSGTSTGRRKAQGSSLAGRKVAPKYRNPANPRETWAGRGARPRWLQAALKDGKSVEDFVIKGSTSGRGKAAVRKGKRTKGRKST